MGLLLSFVAALPISLASYALLLWLNPYLLILGVPVKVIVFLATCLLVLVAMDLMVVFIDRIPKKLKEPLDSGQTSGVGGDGT